MPSLRYRPLSDASELSDFYCNVDVMDSFIHDGLEDELREKNCEAFVVLDDDDSIIGFFAICEDDLELSPEDKDEMMSGISIAKTPRFSTMQDKTQFAIQNMFAAKEIAYLAIRKDKQRKGIGTAILNLIRNMTAHDAPDHYFLTVDALCINGYSAVGFYSKFGFQCVNWDTYSCRMFCTIIPDSDDIDG